MKSAHVFLALVAVSCVVGCNALPWEQDDTTAPDAAFVAEAGDDTSVAEAGDDTSVASDSGATDATSAADAASDASVDVGKSDASASDARADAPSSDVLPDSLPPCPVSPTGMLPRAVWSWRTATFTDATEKAAFFTFATSHAIDTVYVQVALTNMPATGADASPLGQFIAEAATKCIRVELLVGEAHWALAGHHATAVSRATAAVQFTNALTGAKPQAFHVDIEPHGIHAITVGSVTYDWNNDGSGSTTNQRPEILNQFLDGAGKLKTALGTTLPLHADIAFWLDSTTIAVNPLQRTSGGVAVGAPRQAYQFVIDAVDRTHIMAYRDKAFGATCTMASCSANGIYDLSKTEVDYAASVGKKAVVAVETGNYGASISFYEETVAVMDAELGKVAGAYGTNAGFGGFAVHDLIGYRTLQAKP